MWGIVYYVCSGNDVGIYDDDVYGGSKVTWRLLLLLRLRWSVGWVNFLRRRAMQWRISTQVHDDDTRDCFIQHFHDWLFKSCSIKWLWLNSSEILFLNVSLMLLFHFLAYWRREIRILSKMAITVRTEKKFSRKHSHRCLLTFFKSW